MHGSNFREDLIALSQPRGTLLTQLPPAEEAGEAEVEAAGMVEAALQGAKGRGSSGGWVPPRVPLRPEGKAGARGNGSQSGRRERLILQPGRLRQPERGHVWLETFMVGWDTELLAGALQIPADSC